jgi:dienelactone hydrolase
MEPSLFGGKSPSWFLFEEEKAVLNNLKKDPLVGPMLGLELDTAIDVNPNIQARVDKTMPELLAIFLRSFGAKSSVNTVDVITKLVVPNESDPSIALPLVEGIVEHINTRFNIQPQNIHLMGFSQGGALALAAAKETGVKAVSSIMGFTNDQFDYHAHQNFCFVWSKSDRMVKPNISASSIDTIRDKLNTQDNFNHYELASQPHIGFKILQETKDSIRECLRDWKE